MKKAYNICEILYGSHLYGTNTPSSDTDIKRVYVPSSRDIALQRVLNTIKDMRDKSIGEKNGSDDIDIETFSLQQYLNLLCEGQTMAVDMLFSGSHPKCVRMTSPIWQEIYDNRHRLLCKKSASFVGYVRDQANKYGVKGSRVAAVRDTRDTLIEAIDKFGIHAKVNEAKDVLLAVVERHPEHTKFIDKFHIRQNKTEILFECCNRKVSMTSNLKHAFEIYDKVFQEYGDRALRAESNDGIDWKAMSHAVRVSSEATELFLTGSVTFPRPDFKHLLDVKLGRLEFKEVGAEIDAMFDNIESIAASSSLRDEPDREWVDDFVEKVYSNQF